MVKIKNRISASDFLSKYDYLRNKDDKAFIEVTEWGNQEGIDIKYRKRK